ncbi:MAG: hypothetical protein ABFD25_00855 [Clostridiaceae bacterium]
MHNNYIANKREYEDLGDNKLRIDGKIYSYDGKLDPEYQDDGVIDISYYPLVDEDNEPTNMVFAFDKRENVSGPQEWCDEYDAEHPYVLSFN